MAPCGKSGAYLSVRSTLTAVAEQIKDAADDKGRPSWVNFKIVVWHQSMYKLLESIEQHSKIGTWVECGDGVVWHIFLLILILAADYKEQ